MPVDVKYTTTAPATGGRDGRAATKDGSLEVKLATPKELGGGGGNASNPEQLFAAGYAACFLGAMKFVAGQRKIKLPDDTTIASTVGIGAIPGGFGIEVAMDIKVPGMDRAQAEDIVQAAHKVCPYSNATRNNIDVRLRVA